MPSGFTTLAAAPAIRGQQRESLAQVGVWLPSYCFEGRVINIHDSISLDGTMFVHLQPPCCVGRQHRSNISRTTTSSLAQSQQAQQHQVLQLAQSTLVVERLQAGLEMGVGGRRVLTDAGCKDWGVLQQVSAHARPLTAIAWRGNHAESQKAYFIVWVASGGVQGAVANVH